MTQYTNNDLAVRTLRDLNIIGAEEMPAAADLAFTLETIQSEFARMEADGMPFGNASTSYGSYNHSIFTELSRRMGFAIGPAFGVMSAGEGQAGEMSAENKLWKVLKPVKWPELLTVERGARGTRIRDPIISQ